MLSCIQTTSNKPEKLLQLVSWFSWMYDDAGTKATNTHLEYIIPIAFPLQEWLCKRSSMLRYAYIAFFFFLSKRRKGLMSFGQWQRYPLVNVHGNKTVSKAQPLHVNFTKHSVSSISECKTQTFKRIQEDITSNLFFHPWSLRCFMRFTALPTQVRQVTKVT